MKRLIVAALAIVLTAALVQAQCYTFYEGLCPGASNCMCTLGEACSGSGSGSNSSGDYAAGLARARAADGSCSGSCQYVETGECPGDSSCLAATGPCGSSSSGSGPGPAPAPPAPSNNSVIQCAQTWVDEQIPYCQCNGAAECCGTCPYCSSYRCDCSGYVSYCLGLSYGYTTDSLPQVTTPITQSELVPGDIMLCVGTHVAFFAGWTDDTMTNFVCYQEPGCHTTGPHHAMVSVEPYPFSWNPTCFQPYAPNSGESDVKRLRHKMEKDGVIVAKKHDKKCNKNKGANNIAPRSLIEQAAQTQRSYPPEHEAEALAAAEKVREHLAGLGIKAGF